MHPAARSFWTPRMVVGRDNEASLGLLRPWDATKESFREAVEELILHRLNEIGKYLQETLALLEDRIPGEWDCYPMNHVENLEDLVEIVADVVGIEALLGIKEIVEGEQVEEKWVDLVCPLANLQGMQDLISELHGEWIESNGEQL